MATSRLTASERAMCLLRDGTILDQKVNCGVVTAVKVEAFGHVWLVTDVNTKKPVITQIK